MDINIRSDLKSKSSLARKKSNEWFFKTGKGEYGEGDIFIGVTVPGVRQVAKKYYKEISLTDLQTILHSKIHEERLLALIILVMKYQKATDKKQKQTFFKFYLKNLKWVNNWDLVDTSASYIVGDYLFNFLNRDFTLLKKLAKSKKLWEKRVGIVSCFYFIKNKSCVEILEVAEILKNDKHDLLQKALGWMLREVYKNVNEGVVREFLGKEIKTLPRTTLRYTIEKMDLQERKRWLAM